MTIWMMIGDFSTRRRNIASTNTPITIAQASAISQATTTGRCSELRASHINNATVVASDALAKLTTFEVLKIKVSEIAPSA
jgi:hypothetical protein